MWCSPTRCTSPSRCATAPPRRPPHRASPRAPASSRSSSRTRRARPAFLIDLLLALSISLALVILMVSMYTQQPLEFSTFPSVLLVVTLFRLALNVASTRLILLHGHEGSGAAGHVIRAFGNFVVGGSYVVGLVVFLILVVINFAVITKGAGRSAEGAAPFTLP